MDEVSRVGLTPQAPCTKWWWYSPPLYENIRIMSNNFAVSSTDISLALTKTSTAMSALGNDIDETIGLVTAGWFIACTALIDGEEVSGAYQSVVYTMDA